MIHSTSLVRRGPDAGEDDLAHLSWTLLGIGERQRRAPRAAPHEPTIDTDVVAQPFDVGDEVGSGVRRQVRGRLRSMRRAAATLALIELHDEVTLGIEQSPGVGRHAAAGTTVQDQRRLARRVARRLPVDLMAVTDIEHAGRDGLRDGERGGGHDRSSSSRPSSTKPATTARPRLVPTPVRCGLLASRTPILLTVGFDMRELETDYLVVGAGATGMAFTDALIGESDADVVMVDRRHRPGGHWNDDYPFVRLHQPSALYGVLSRPLGHDRIDESGPNAGFYERATAAELCDYYGRVLDEHLVPSGQVRFLGMHDYLGGHDGEHHLRSRLTGATTTVRVRRRLVDATYMESSLPSTHSPPFAVDPDAPGRRPERPRVAVALAVGVHRDRGGQDLDGHLLLAGRQRRRSRRHPVDPSPRCVDQRPGGDPAAAARRRASREWLAAMNEASAAATDLRDLCPRLEEAGVLRRLDPDVEPTFFRGAILSESERATLSSIGQVVRMGRVRHVGATHIELEQGSIPTDHRHVHVDCTAAGLACAPNRTVFEEDRITLQWIQNGIAPFNAALIGWVEANRDDDTGAEPAVPAERVRARGRRPQPRPPVGRHPAQQSPAWMAEPDLNEWLGTCRLSPLGNAGEHLGGPAMDALMRMLQHQNAAIENLQRLLAEDSAAAPT